MSSTYVCQFSDPIEKIDAFSTESETFSMLKVSISAYFCHIFHAFFTNSENATKIQIQAGNAEYLMSVKIHGIAFGILRMKSQFQPDFTSNFITRGISSVLQFDLYHECVTKYKVVILLNPILFLEQFQYQPLHSLHDSSFTSTLLLSPHFLESLL